MDERLHQSLPLVHGALRQRPLDPGAQRRQVRLRRRGGLVLHRDEQLRAAGAQVRGAGGDGVEALAAQVVGERPRLEGEQVALDGVVALLQVGLDGGKVGLQAAALTLLRVGSS
jgi:hypothetical protein